MTAFWLLLFMAIGILLTTLTKGLWKAKGKSPPLDINYEELEAAEDLLTQETEEFTAVEVFKNVREDTIAEVAGYLDSMGIAATYEAGPTTYNFLNTYTLKVRPSQVEEAKRVLEIYRKSQGSPK